MGLYHGYIEGNILQEGTTDVLLPFQDKVTEASFQYEGELIFSETFSAKGVKGNSAACLHKEMAKFTVNSDDITWSLMQAASATLDNARAITDVIPVTETFEIKLPLVSGNSTVTLSATPAVGADIFAADADGKQYPVTASGTTITFVGDLTGKQITVRYSRAVSGTAEREIQLGNGTRVKESGVYGRFFGCAGTLLIIARRAVIKPKLDFSVGSNPATVGLELECLRDASGNFATIVKLDSGVAL